MLILASTSRYRRELLSRLALPFDAIAPAVDERALPGESARAQVERLARDKALAVHRRHPGAVVIGSDQLAVAPDGVVLGKPGSVDVAHAQLRRCRGGTVVFHTAVAVVAGDRSPTTETVDTSVTFRALTDDAIARYVAIEAPLDCAGSFKCEGLGIALFERLASDDPTALVGLPLIATARLLRAAGFDPLR